MIIYISNIVSKIVSYILSAFGLISIFNLFFDITGKMMGKEKEKSRKIYNELIEERTKRKRLKEELETKEEKIKSLKETEGTKKERLDYVLKALGREGIKTSYLVEKYKKPLNSILMLFSHQKPPSFIKDKIKELDGKITFKGKLGLIPPKNSPQGRMSGKNLESWFEEKFLKERGDYQYKVRIMRIDLKEAYTDKKIDEDTWKSPEYDVLPDFFDISDLMSYEDIFEIISDEISLNDEIKENIGLLAVPVATKEQLEEILKPENQLEIQEKLGNLEQLVNTPPRKIEGVLSKYVDNADTLSKDLKKEARSMKQNFDL